MTILASRLTMQASQLRRPLAALPNLPAGSFAAPRRRCCAVRVRAAAEPTVAPPQPPTNDSASTPSTSAPVVEVVNVINGTAAATPTADATPAPASAPADAPVAPSAPAAPTAAPTAAAAGSAGAANENFTGEMLKPSVVNTPLVRAASVLLAVGAVAGSSVFLSNAVGAFLHVTAYAVLLGTQLWNTFFVGITMFKNLPRQTFGRVQAKMFPQYFALTAGANMLALTTLALAGAATTAAGTRALVALAVSLAGLLANWLYVEPICTGLMFERYDIENLPEKTEDDKAKIAALYKQFGKWHGISSLINLVSFCVVVAHGWFLATLLVISA